MFVEIMKHTPVWVFFLFAALVYLGILQTMQRTVSIMRLALLPAAMLDYSIYGVVSAFGATANALALWLAGFAAAIALNRLLRRPRGVGYAQATRTFAVPGSWMPFALMMTIFFTKYAVAVAMALDSSLHDTALFVGIAGAVYGFLSGMFTARALHIRSAAKQAPETKGSSPPEGEIVLRPGEIAGY
jgi:hypothetical protein